MVALSDEVDFSNSHSFGIRWLWKFTKFFIMERKHASTSFDEQREPSSPDAPFIFRNHFYYNYSIFPCKVFFRSPCCLQFTLYIISIFWSMPSCRALTTVELHKKLRGKKFPLHEVEAVIADFQGRYVSIFVISFIYNCSYYYNL